jgi:hypothetical protein
MKKIVGASKAIASARTGVKEARNVRRARAKLRAFVRAVAKGEKREHIDPLLSALLQDLANGATAELSVLSIGR